jgi:hypothetical protein
MMNMILVAERIFTEKLSNSSVEMLRKNDSSRYIEIAAGIATFTGMGFLIFAAYLWLEKNYQADVVAGVTGLMAIGLGCFLMLMSIAIVRRRQKSLKKLKDEIYESLNEIVNSMDKVLTDPVRQNPKTATLLATIVGFVVGEKTL